MPRYLAGRNLPTGGVEIFGTVEAADVCEALRLARTRWPNAAIMPPKAVRVYMRRGAALNEAFQRRSGD